jgi:peptide/nickel transport system permease protein
MTVPESGVAAPTRTDHLFRRVLRRPLGAIALAYLVLLILAVIFAPLIMSQGPLTEDLQHVFSGPSAQHLLGTDSLGRDTLSRLLYGGRTTLVSVAYAVATLIVLGIPIGVLAGYFGGWLDTIIGWLTDIVLAIPVIITLLVVLAVFGQNEHLAMVAFGVLGAPGLVRITRGATIAIRQDLYITAARVSGLSSLRIILRHVLPRIAGPIIIRTALFAGAAVVTETSLAFLGLSVQDPQPSWGGMVADASNVISQHPFLLFPPGLIIAFTVLALGLLGDAVRDSMVQDRTQPQVRRPRKRPAAEPQAAEQGAAASLPTDPDALLSIRGLTVSIDGTPVIADISFDVRPGETLGLVGESGCGKSITGRAILGLLPTGGQVTAGSCFFDSRDLTKLSQREYRSVRGSQIALISQEPSASLDPNRTVGAQLAQLVRLHRGGSRAVARKRVIALLEQVRMADPPAVARRYPHELSGGMAQRVCIAAALVGNPQLLIADEPTTALDVTVQANILDLLRTVQQDTNMAILLVTHDWGVVADTCDRAVVMYAGQVVESTSVRSMFRQPLHPYTDGLLSSNPHGAPIGEPLPAIRGRVPRPGAWPVGCHFQARCRLAQADCEAGPIAVAEPVSGRLTRCLHHDLLLQGADAL